MNLNKPMIGMDGLRALACLAVFGVHWQQLTGVSGQLGPIEFGRLLENGNTGVALFMILSGLLLARPWFASLSITNETSCPLNSSSPSPPSSGERGPGGEGPNRQPSSLIRYLRNRAGRILPAYLVCLAALAILDRSWQSKSEQLDVALHLVFLHNLSPQTLYSINPPFWALAVIVQFYVFFGLMIGCLRWSGCLSARTIIITSIVFAITSQIAVGLLRSIEPTTPWSRAWVGQDPICLEHSLLSHFALFSLGIVIAAIDQKFAFARSRWLDALVIVCLGCVLAILATPIDDVLQFPGGRYNFPFIPLLLAAIIFASSRSVWVASILESFPLRRLGIISFGFYLFHLPIMKAILKVAHPQAILLEQHPLAFALVSLVATILVSELSFRCLETPLGNSIRGRRPTL